MICQGPINYPLFGCALYLKWEIVGEPHQTHSYTTMIIQISPSKWRASFKILLPRTLIVSNRRLTVWTRGKQYLSKVQKKEGINSEQGIVKVWLGPVPIVMLIRPRHVKVRRYFRNNTALWSWEHIDNCIEKSQTNISHLRFSSRAIRTSPKPGRMTYRASGSVEGCWRGEIIEIYFFPIKQKMLWELAKWPRAAQSFRRCDCEWISSIYGCGGRALLIINFSTSSKWQSRRKIITPTFHFSILKSYKEVFAQEGRVRKFQNSDHNFGIFRLWLINSIT